MPDTTASTTARPSNCFPSRCPPRPSLALGEWHGRGLCVGEDPDVFFPSHGDPGTEARQICAACRVRDDCLNYAIRG